MISVQPKPREEGRRWRGRGPEPYRLAIAARARRHHLGRNRITMGSIDATPVPRLSPAAELPSSPIPPWLRQRILASSAGRRPMGVL